MMRLGGTVLLLAGAVACGASLDAENPSGLPAGSHAISTITPNFGPPSGGTSVTINGSGFTLESRVFFGNAELSATYLDTNTLVVTSPNAGVEATVDVRVRTDTQEALVPDGFAFTNSAPDTDTGTTSGTGLTGGLVEFQRIQYACPSCVGKPDFEVTASAAFHQPVAGSWSDSFVPMGQCLVNPGGSAPVTATIDAGEWAYLEFASTAMALHRSNGSLGPKYTASNLTVNDYVSNGAYDVSVSGGSGLGAFEVVSAFRTAEGFDSVQPQELLYTNEASAFSAVLSSSGTALSWSPSGSGTGFVVAIEAYDYYSGNPLGRILVCHGPDNGYLSVPGSAMQQLTGGSPALATVTLLRRQESEAVIPVNGATLQTISMAGVSGTATIY